MLLIGAIEDTSVVYKINVSPKDVVLDFDLLVENVPRPYSQELKRTFHWPLIDGVSENINYIHLEFLPDHIVEVELKNVASRAEILSNKKVAEITEDMIVFPKNLFMNRLN